MAKKTKLKAKAKPTKKAVSKAKAKPAKPAKKTKAKVKAKVKPLKKSASAKLTKAKAKTKAKPKAKAFIKTKAKPAKKAAKGKGTVKVKAKINAKTLKLVLNKPFKTIEKVKEKKLSPSNGNGSSLKLRYSDKDLVEFKQIITEKLVEARKDLDLLRSSMSHLDDHGTDDTSPTFKLMEDGSDVLTKEETAQLAARQQKFIKHLEDAMLRIENKSYGICRVTGNLIPKERLRVVPHATLSIEAKQKQF